MDARRVQNKNENFCLFTMSNVTFHFGRQHGSALRAISFLKKLHKLTLGSFNYSQHHLRYLIIINFSPLSSHKSCKSAVWLLLFRFLALFSLSVFSNKLEMVHNTQVPFLLSQIYRGERFRFDSQLWRFSLRAIPSVNEIVKLFIRYPAEERQIFVESGVQLLRKRLVGST